MPVLERYAALLAAEGVEWGLLGPREVPRLWERHLLNCAAVAPLVPDGSDLADIGAGAGLPGLVLAITRPDLRVTLIEPLLRRARFLELAVERLDLPRVRVLRTRAESAEARAAGPFEVVTARAVAPLDRLAGWCLPLVRPGGWFLALKGTRAQAELDAAGAVLRRLGAREATVAEVSTSASREPTIVVTMRRASTAGRGAR